VNISGEIGLSGQTASDLIAAVGDAEKIVVALDSIGGSMSAGIQLFDAFHTRDVEVQIIGHCYSAAIPVVLAARRIVMLRNTTMMVHKAVSFCLGNEEDLECHARGVRKLNLRLREIIAQRTEQPLATVDDWLSRDSYFSAPEALAAGLVDEIVEPPAALETVADAGTPEAPEPTQTEDEAIFHAFLGAMGSIKVRSKTELGRSLTAWLVHKVTETC
jgi:ATP-dependent protease ClpP protease subunit